MTSLLKLLDEVKKNQINIENPMNMICEYPESMKKVQQGEWNRIITETQVYFENEKGEMTLLGSLDTRYKL